MSVCICVCVCVYVCVCVCVCVRWWERGHYYLASILVDIDHNLNFFLSNVMTRCFTVYWKREENF